MVTDARRWQRILLAAASACLVLLPGAPGGAQQVESPSEPQAAEYGTSTFIRAPDGVSNPTPQTGLVELVDPKLPEQRRRLPAFLADTSLKLHFRTFFFDRENDDDTTSAAWALGGWVSYQSGWLLDTFAMGAIGVLGEAWAALRYKAYAVLKGYRQLIDEGYVNPQDNRMVPNTFEALMLSGQVGWTRYDVGYIWNIKPRDSNDFISMSERAGAAGENEGLLLTALALAPIKDLSLYVGNYYVANVFNTAFGKAEYTYNLAEDLTLQFGYPVHRPAERGGRAHRRLQHVEHRRRDAPPVERTARGRRGAPHG
jgi:hypothetical protein